MHYNRNGNDSSKLDSRRLEEAYERQEDLVRKLQKENKELSLDKERYIQKGVMQERKRNKKIHDRQAKSKAISTKAASLASMFVVGYYMLASELDLWIVSEDFTRSEWTQAIMTSMVVWLIEQVYNASKGK
tara:strand:- start:3372 stop:3764 length:393 start_codon:yes stop_codon:yes gene_type:complete